MSAYATLLRRHLAESRRDGRTYEAAWAAAQRAYPKPSDLTGWTPAVLADAKRWFRLGYYGQGDGAVSLLVERDEGRVIDFPPSHEPTVRLCGSGEGCREPADPWLCPRHAAEITAAFERSEHRSRGFDGKLVAA